jgi:acetoacetyl-CoA synthetase
VKPRPRQCRSTSGMTLMVRNIMRLISASTPACGATEITSASIALPGGITFFGRSDAVLKPSGVRIGTAEIYNQMEKLKEIADSLVVGQEWQGDQRIILFVRLAPGFELTDDLKGKIRKTLRENASPRHVPARIIAVPEIPYTFNMKKVEIAVTNIINNKPVLNAGALVNPESLDYYRRILPELQKP